jgi:O-methyltransferase
MGLGLLPKLISATQVIASPAIIHFYLNPMVGREYGFGLPQKLKLLRQIRRNARSIVTGTSWLEHMLLVTRILSLPKDMPGDVLEAGCFKGSSTSSLSLACAAVGRKLIVCDSFEGLPEIAADDAVHVSLAANRYEVYSKGEYRGQLDEVKANISRFGNIDVCSFVKGYFDQTLSGIKNGLAMIFLDVDLHSSLRTCLIELWPHLAEGGYLYTHEAQQLEYVRIFFDQSWWAQQFETHSPGLIGAGSGLPAGLSHASGLGYCRKFKNEQSMLSGLTRFGGDPTKTAAVGN